MIGYGILLALALGLNARDTRMLALTCVVGAGIFVPIPDAYFYFWCGIVECMVIIFSILLDAAASKAVIRISVLLLLFHGLGLLLNGYPSDSPYHIMVKISEHAELLACVLLSRPLIRMVPHA